MINIYRYSKLLPEEREIIEKEWIDSSSDLQITKYWDENKNKKFKKIFTKLKRRIANK